MKAKERLKKIKTTRLMPKASIFMVKPNRPMTRAPVRAVRVLAIRSGFGFEGEFLPLEWRLIKLRDVKVIEIYYISHSLPACLPACL